MVRRGRAEETLPCNSTVASGEMAGIGAPRTNWVFNVSSPVTHESQHASQPVPSGLSFQPVSRISYNLGASDATIKAPSNQDQHPRIQPS